MNKSTIVGLVILGLGAVMVIMSITKYNTFVNLEEQLDAVHTDSKNIYSKISNNMRSQAGITDKYSKDVLKAIELSIGGRYGEGGAKQGMLWLKEQNPSMDVKMYTKLSSIVDAGYAEFADIQTRKTDVARRFKSAMRVFPGNVIAGMFGFPTKNMKEITMVVTNKATTKAFTTGEAEAIEMFPSK